MNEAFDRIKQALSSIHEDISYLTLVEMSHEDIRRWNMIAVSLGNLYRHVDKDVISRLNDSDKTSLEED